MEATKHTPGPWRVFADTIQTSPRLFSNKIAEVCSHNENKDFWKANAQLMAASPELLEALEFIVNCTPAPGEDAVLNTEGYNKACAAIAKAKGL